MLCPCCGKDIPLGAQQCRCGARFVGEPLGEPPFKVQRLGPVMVAIGLLAAVVASALIITKWLALAGLLVVWASRRAMRLARREPEGFGGYRTAAATLIVTLGAGAVAAGYTLAYVPTFLEDRQAKREAHTRAEFYRVAGKLEAYKRKYGSYPSTPQDYAKAIDVRMPIDYWENGIKYQGYGGAVASLPSSGVSGISFPNFELRSAGADEIEGTDDDIIMRDGIFFTNAEIKKQPLVIVEGKRQEAKGKRQK
ncbi:MAG TPA: hypothetical protein VF131_04000 [Blastocatellia bacterium]|nr:hypothetical protein [Blastocatellia bacterium]